jgi:hypothetical protein
VLPFSEEQFLRVFADYNRAVWPAQLVLYCAATLTLLVAFGRRAYSGLVAAAFLALSWLWMGVAYHLAFFASINKAAYLFGAFFILQGLLYLEWGVRGPSARFRIRADVYGVAAAALLAYSLAVYPALGYLLGRVYPAAPTFGLPCPTTIFTFGLLLCAGGRVPARLLPIPLAWSLVGASAATTLGVTEDYGLMLAGPMGTLLILVRNHRYEQHRQPVTA